MTVNSTKQRAVNLSPNEPFLPFFPGYSPQTQMRSIEGNRRIYNPARDIAYLGDHLMMSVLERLAKDKELHALAEKLGVGDAQVACAMERYFKFIDTAVLSDVEKLPTFDEHVAATGIMDLEPNVRMYVNLVLGEATLLSIFQGKRSVSAYDVEGTKIDGTPDSEELRRELTWMQGRITRPLGWRDRLKAIWRLLLKGR